MDVGSVGRAAGEVNCCDCALAQALAGGEQLALGVPPGPCPVKESVANGLPCWEGEGVGFRLVGPEWALLVSQSETHDHYWGRLG